MINHRDRVMTATSRRLTLLALMAALLGATAAPAAIASAAHAEATRALPDVREFREGDAWDAFNADETRRAGTPTYDAYVVSHGRWVGRSVGLQAALHPNPRLFTDLAGQGPRFPDPWRGGFWAAPDGQLYLPTDKANSWNRVPVGTVINPVKAASFQIAERMTQAQADQLTRRLTHSAAPAPHAPRAQGSAERIIYCPNGHSFSTAVSGPVGLGPGEMSLVAACAAYAPSPLKR